MVSSGTRRAWHALPASWRSRLQGPAQAAVFARLSAGRARAAPPAPGPLIVSGYLAERFGIARGAAATLAGLRQAGYAPVAHDVGPTLREGGLDGAPLLPDHAGGVWIVHLNAPEALAVLSKHRLADWKDRYLVGYWAWELPSAPPAWLRIARLFDEVWVPSAYVASSFAALGDKVRVVPHFVGTGPSPPLPTDVFGVLVAGDPKSSLHRKNLAGGIEAFLRAFPAPVSDASLTIKVGGPKAPLPIGDALRERIAARPDVTVLTGALSDEAMTALTARTAAFLSLHRAEGFGLMIAEALAAGRPAIATGWSGNAGFMAPLPELMVRSRPVPVRDAAGVYAPRPGDEWAEPDLGDAAEKLKRAYATWRSGETPSARYRAAIRANDAAWSADATGRWPFAALVARGWRAPS